MLLAKIREKTLDFHDDFTSWANPILTNRIELEHYKLIIKTFYGFYKPLEEKFDLITELETIGLEPNKRKKTPILLNDLKSLGVTDEEINSITPCNDLPDIEDLSQALGCFYVVEGATLGGQIVANKLLELLKLENNGAGFFNSYGEAVRPMWKTFCDTLNNYSEDPEVQNRVAEAALQTYFKFNDWLKQLPR